MYRMINQTRKLVGQGPGLKQTAFPAGCCMRINYQCKASLWLASAANGVLAIKSLRHPEIWKIQDVEEYKSKSKLPVSLYLKIPMCACVIEG